MNYDEDSKDIYISDQELDGLFAAWNSQVGRPPNEQEALNIVNDFIEEEILYREALRLGLDQNDRIIKRRLAQKITFLKQETDRKEPSSKKLIDFFDRNRDRYYVPPTFSFTHYYFSSDRNGKQRAQEAMKSIADKNLPKSDPFMLGKNFVEKSIFEIERDFGDKFTEFLYEPTFDVWLGPIQSAYGYHIVKLLNKIESFTPNLNQVKEKVEVDFYLEEKQKTLDSYLTELRDKYQVIINPKYIFNE